MPHKDGTIVTESIYKAALYLPVKYEYSGKQLCPYVITWESENIL